MKNKMNLFEVEKSIQDMPVSQKLFILHQLNAPTKVYRKFIAYISDNDIEVIEEIIKNNILHSATSYEEYIQFLDKTESKLYSLYQNDGKKQAHLSNKWLEMMQRTDDYVSNYLEDEVIKLHKTLVLILDKFIQNQKENNFVVDNTPYKDFNLFYNTFKQAKNLVESDNILDEYNVILEYKNKDFFNKIDDRFKNIKSIIKSIEELWEDGVTFSLTSTIEKHGIVFNCFDLKKQE